MSRPRVPEAELKRTPAGGLVPTSPGWFVLNARDARWWDKPGQGYSLPLTGTDEYEAETSFPMLGMSIRVMHPGEPSTTYHWETVHCPPETRHAFVGAGDGPSVLLCASSRQFQKDGPWGFYCADETATRHNAAPPEDTQDTEIADARFPPTGETTYPGGLLPEN